MNKISFFSKWVAAGVFVVLRTGAAQNVFAQASTETPSNAQEQKLSNPSTGPWSGWLVSSACNADEAFAESPECMKTLPDAQKSLYDDTNRVMYNLDPQEKINAKLGDAVTVRGTYDGETLHVTSLELMTIGLAVGEKAPAFSAPDQNGQTHSLESLKGANGTVLLFFRSADW